MAYRKGMKGSKKSELGRDPGKRHVPGFLGRSSVKRAQGRTGYTEGEMKLGPGGKGRKIGLSKG